ncbi:MAG: glycoside hydrolase [Acidobacteriaceae bacterium]|nr:glycoside hydrolase [Acidobacteriaceae bacterium]
MLAMTAGTGIVQAQTNPVATTAWRAGRFHVDAKGVIGRSDIVLGRANTAVKEAMQLGNGSLGVAVWSEQGLTAQLNRADTMPDRLSPGQVVVPGLSSLTGAADYAGRLDLYNGEFREQGGGMTATAYVQPDTDTLVIEVTGAKPDASETAVLKLWEPRSTHAAVNERVGVLSDSWLDNKNPEWSGLPFGSLSAITVEGRDVSAKVTDERTITVSFRPFADGHFRVLASAPHFDGKGDVFALARTALAGTNPEAHRAWWHRFWNRAAMVRIDSPDGTGEYMENLRNIYLFSAAAERGTEYPGTQGIADMLSSARDVHQWDPSAFWHWNLRMQVAANMGAGLPELNAPFFNLYRENLPSIEAWTRQHMKVPAGACVPETMRFNGRGVEYERRDPPEPPAYDCDADFPSYYNARTLSTGAEISLEIWRQYQMTRDRAFLEKNYPVMASAARFLLGYQKIGSDGLLHTSPSNAHEQRWDVTDPTTDLSATQALYPAVIQAARLLGKDPQLVRDLQNAIPKIPALPRAYASDLTKLVSASDAQNSDDVIADSYLPEAEARNFENVGLEPVWPYGVIGDTSPLFPLAIRTFEHRPYKGAIDWSNDPVQAARLHLGDDMASMLRKITEQTQLYANGFSGFDSTDKEFPEFYIEQSAHVALALQEALVQDYDGVIRIAPALPSGWDFAGSVFVSGKTRVNVETRRGEVVTAVIEAGTTEPLRVRSPWPGKQVDVITGDGHRKVVSGSSESELRFNAVAGTSYLIQKHDAPVTALPFAPVSGTAAREARKLGPVQIGIPPGPAR